MKEHLFLALASLVFWLAGPWLRFAVGPASHVSILSFHLAAVYPKYVLMKSSSFAIWNMKKVVVAFSTAVWLTNVTIMIIGEFHPSILNPCKPDWVPASTQVNIIFLILRPLALSIHRFTLYGSLFERPVSLPTLKTARLLLSSYFWPTLFCFSSCLLACYAFAVVVAVLLSSAVSFGNRCDKMVLVGRDFVDPLIHGI